MHPALSVILFTVASGAGYGSLALFGLLVACGWVTRAHAPGLTVLALGLGLVTAGLLSSTFHLGHPERAWRALSQWRSSWLSREGVAATASYVPALLFALSLALDGGASTTLFALATLVMALITVGCTAMIYRSLKPVHQWHNGFVLPVYLAFSAATGALWVNAALLFRGADARAAAAAGLLALATVAALKLGYWRFIDTTAGPATAGSATGLGPLGRVRLFEAPHSGSNYLLREMGFIVARKHALKLRRIVLAIGLAAPFALSGLTLATGAAAPALALLAALLATFGALVERWLFFAEAKHSVTLYYGAERA